MPEKKKIRNDQEWLELIQECRISGLSDREWCQMHSISINTFYNKVSDLRKKACEIPKSRTAPSRQKHEVVPIEIACNPALCPEHTAGDALRVPTTCAAVTVRMPGYSIEIADGASEETIQNTLLAGAAVLGALSGDTKVYIITGRTDMRRSFDGLMAIIRDTYQMDPYADALYL